MTAPLPLALTPATPLRFGPFELDAAQARLSRDGTAVALRGRPLDVLLLLAANPGRLISKDELLDALWGHRHVSESVLKTAVNTVRTALGDDARAPRFIETVPRRGVRFVAELQAAAAAAPPLAQAALTAPAGGNLPAQMAALVGRQADLHTALGLLTQERLVTLTGLGGVGKTRLALAVAGAAPPPPGGKWLLRLDDLQEPAQLLPTLAELLGLGSAAATSAEALGRALATLELLLMLDNAEHLIDAVAGLAAAVLAAAPRVRLLVTSQVPLRLGPERVLPLMPLGLPTALADAEPDPAGYAAAQLLCERIRQQRPQWTPAPAEHADIAAVCRALDGVPLALELAAARVPLFGLGGVRERLRERFSLLTKAPRDAAARHRTLAAALDWTFGLLAPAEREALQRLAVFGGSFALADAEGVLDEVPGLTPLDAIDELCARCLLVQDEVLGEPRLRLYDSVRRHALDALQRSGRDGEARQRLLDWLVQRVQGLYERDLFEPRQHWLPAYLADLESLRTALRFGLAESAPPAATLQALRLLAQGLMVWLRSGHRNEAWDWMQRAQARATALGEALDDTTRGWLDFAQAPLAALMQRVPPAPALQAADRLLAASAAWPLDAPHRFVAEYYRAHLCLRVAPERDLNAMAEALHRCMSADWPPLVQRFTLNLDALLARRAGDYARYAALGREVALLGERLGAPFEGAPGAAVHGQGLALLGQLEAACRVYRSALEQLRQHGLVRELPTVLYMTAALHLRQRADDEALALTVDALRLLEAEGMVWWLADALPWAAWHDGRPADAAALQAWSDACVAARGEHRGPVFESFRVDLLAALETLGLGLPTAAEARPAGDAEAIRLALGAGCCWQLAG